MLENCEVMFDKMYVNLDGLKKQKYIETMEEFRTTYADIIEEMVNSSHRDTDEEKEASVKKMAETFADKIYNRFVKFKRVSVRTKLDASLFMVYYVFTSILMTEDENATLICDTLRDAWRVKFKNPDFSYTTYDELLKDFNTKIFGLF